MRKKAVLVTLAGMSVMGCAIELTNVVPAGPQALAELKRLERKAYNADASRFLDDANAVASTAFRRQLGAAEILCAPEQAWQFCRARGLGELVCDRETKKAKPGARDVVAQVAFILEKEKKPVEENRAPEAFNRLFQQYDELLKPIEAAYGRFQDHRRLLSELPHDETLLQTTVQQGLIAMYAARQLLDFHDGLKGLSCSVRPFDGAVEATKTLSEEIRGQLAGLLRQVEQVVDPLAFELLQVEYGVLSGEDVGKRCDEVYDRLAGGDVVYDGALAGWCGYSYHLVGNTAAALKYFELAGRSAHNPDATNYGLVGQRNVNHQVMTAKLRKVENTEAE